MKLSEIMNELIELKIKQAHPLYTGRSDMMISADDKRIIELNRLLDIFGAD